MVPLVSIITVCYNAEKYIAETIQSVVSQSFKNYEYIIIDGASSDQTLSIIQSFGTQVHVVVSERDAGIYDAMNKGLARATGDFVLFMNAGDTFYDAQVLAHTFAQQTDADFYYGDALLITDDGKPLALFSEVRNRKPPAQLTKGSMKFGMIVSHQAIFIRRSLTVPYSLNHRFSADIDWILNAVENASNPRSVHTGAIIARCRMGGFSQKYVIKSLLDRFAVMRKHYGLIPTLFYHVVILARTFGKKRVRWE